MRTISHIEKGIIDRICEGHVHISKILTAQISDLILNIESDKNVVELILLNDDKSKMFDKVISQVENIIYIQDFIIYLENEGLSLAGHFTPYHLVDVKFGIDIKNVGFSKNSLIVK